MKKLLSVGACAVGGGAGFLAAILAVSVGFGFTKKLEWNNMFLLLAAFGAAGTLLAAGLSRLCGKGPRHVGGLSLAAVFVALLAFEGVGLLRTGGVWEAPDWRALAAIAADGLAAGLFGGLLARLAVRSDRPKFGVKSLSVAVAAVAVLAVVGWLNPPKMPETAHVIEIRSAEHFDREVKQSPIPVVVDYSADWCNPCRRLAPNLDVMAAELTGKVKFVRVDVDKVRQVYAETKNEEGIPLLITFKDGKEVHRDGGFMTVEELRALYGEGGTAWGGPGHN